MGRTIHCTVIEVPDMSDTLHSPTREGFRDLMPWADPYIVALIEKLRNDAEDDDGDAVAELPPSLDDRFTRRPWPGR